MTKLFKVVYYLLIAFVVFIALVLIASRFSLAGGLEMKVVLSGSMEPAIKTGSIVIIKPEENYKDGDVITFGKDTKKNIPTTHRIVKTRVVGGKMLFTTKGDANDDPDASETNKDKVIGKVLFSVPYVGYILDVAKKPLGFAVLIGVPVGVIVFDEVKKIYVEVKKIRREKEEDNDKEEKNT